MKNTFKTYDLLADVYELWSTGDSAYNASFKFYVSQLKNMESPIVELGIGTGRIAFELSLRYHKKIIGIDESARMLEIVQSKYRDRHMEEYIELYREDIASFSLVNKANAIYLPFRTIGHLLKRNEVYELFRRVYDNLNPQGYFIFDHYIFYEKWAKEHNKQRIRMYAGDELLIEDYYDYDFKKQIMNCRIYVNDEEKSHFFFSYQQPEYYLELLDKTGFTVKQMYGDFDCTPFDEDACDQIYICQRNR